MTKENFQKRMDTILKMFEPDYVFKLFTHIGQTQDAMMRLEGGQLDYFLDYMNSEGKRTQRFAGIKTLGNDKLGYDCIRLLAIFNHKQIQALGRMHLTREQVKQLLPFLQKFVETGDLE